MPTEPPHFTRDPSLGADLADAFGGGAGNAEQLIEANNLRYSEDLTAAQLLAPNDELIEKHGLDKAAVAKAADLDEGDVTSFGVRGDSYVIFGFLAPDGRVAKEVLLLDKDGKLERSDEHDSPVRAQIRASVQAQRKISSARSEAEEIIEKARQEAAVIVQEAAEKANKEQAEEGQKQAKAASDRAAKGEPEPDARAAAAKRSAGQKADK